MKPFPNQVNLFNHLSTLIPGKLEIISREHSIRSSTFPAEVVRCRVNNDPVSLLCKYLNGMSHNNFGHRGAIEYEARIYEDILSKISLPSAKFYGLFTQANDDRCMVIEFLDHGELLFRSLEENQIERSVIWIAEFHNLFQDNYPKGINRYDADYYKIWANKVDAIVSEKGNIYPWLINVSNFFRENIRILTDAPLTLIHGEYYPNNIMIHRGQIKPIDWESVAVAPGELDLAASIDGHDHSQKDKAIRTYIFHRWPDGDLDRNAFDERLLMAQIYFHFRWIGGKPRKFEKYANRFEDLQRMGKIARCL